MALGPKGFIDLPQIESKYGHDFTKWLFRALRGFRMDFLFSKYFVLSNTLLCCPEARLLDLGVEALVARALKPRATKPFVNYYYVPLESLDPVLRNSVLLLSPEYSRRKRFLDLVTTSRKAIIHAFGLSTEPSDRTIFEELVKKGRLPPLS